MKPENRDPRVHLTRLPNPIVEAALGKYNKIQRSSNSDSSTPKKRPRIDTGHCFICGDTNIASSSLPPRRYQKQVELYKEFIFLQDFRNQENTSCASCLSDIQQVSKLFRRMQLLEQDIEQIAERGRNKISWKSATGTFHHDDIKVKVEESDAVEKLLEEDTFKVKISNILESEAEDQDSFIDGDKDAVEVETSREEVTEKLVPALQEVVEIEVICDIQPELDTPQDTSNTTAALEDSVKVDLAQSSSPEPHDATKTMRERSRNHVCSECGKYFIGEKMLKKHKDTVACPKLKHICDQCGKEFVGKKKLMKHVNGVHRRIKYPKTKKRYPCSKCTRKLSTRKAQLVHEVLACKVQVDQLLLDRYKIQFYDCDLCEFTTSRPLELESHKLKHTGVKPFPCPNCGQRFSRQTQVSRHLKYICQSSASEENRKKHKDTVAARKILQRQKQAFKCSKCTIKFIHEKNLLHHEKSCVGDSVICDICGKSFRKDRLRAHKQKVHQLKSDEKPGASEEEDDSQDRWDSASQSD